MGSRCVKFGVIALSHTGHWKFNMAPHGKELSESYRKPLVGPGDQGGMLEDSDVNYKPGNSIHYRLQGGIAGVVKANKEYALPPKTIYKYLNCDDPEAINAALFAVGSINRNHNHGYKQTLNRIEKVKVQAVKPDQEVFYMELDVLETKCPSVSPTSVENCAVRPIIEQAVEGDCYVKLLKQGGNFTSLGARCKSELDSAENMYEICPTCSSLAKLNDTRVIHAVDVSLVNFNSGNNTVFYQLHEIGRAQIQAPGAVNVEYVIAATNCSKDDANSGLSACVVQTGAAAHYGGCSGVVVKPEGAADEQITVKCDIYDPQPEQEQQVAAPSDPSAAQHPIRPHDHYHHNLRHSTGGLHSSESSSMEHHAEAGAKHAVRRALTGVPIPPNRPQVVRCPGNKKHF
uniref:Alpha 2-HS glycoprotein n=1 Tax=Leptobrachium leishanense TaxID=445787 RepID=A0A8C5M6W9_9ANUR